MAAPRHDRSSDVRKARAKADPTLRRLLQDADDVREINLSLALNPSERGATPSNVDAAVQNAIKRAEALAGSAPRAVNVLKNIPYLIIRAKPSFIDA